MKKFIGISMFLVALFPGFISLNASESETLKNEVPVEPTWTMVNPGAKVNMQRDHKYATTPYSTDGSWVQNITRNHEDESIAQGYTGYADMLIEKYSSGDNVIKVNNFKLVKGAHKTTTVYNVSTSPQYVSSVDWEIIDGQDQSGSKVIWASVE